MEGASSWFNFGGHILLGCCILLGSQIKIHFLQLLHVGQDREEQIVLILTVLDQKLTSISDSGETCPVWYGKKSKQNKIMNSIIMRGSWVLRSGKEVNLERDIGHGNVMLCDVIP